MLVKTQSYYCQHKTRPLKPCLLSLTLMNKATLFAIENRTRKYSHCWSHICIIHLPKLNTTCTVSTFKEEKNLKNPLKLSMPIHIRICICIMYNVHVYVYIYVCIRRIRHCLGSRTSKMARPGHFSLLWVHIVMSPETFIARYGGKKWCNAMLPWSAILRHLYHLKTCLDHH